MRVRCVFHSSSSQADELSQSAATLSNAASPASSRAHRCAAAGAPVAPRAGDQVQQGAAQTTRGISEQIACRRSKGRACRVMAPICSSSLASVNDRRAPPAAWQRAQDHEWIKVEGKIGIIGITNHAQEQLGDVVFVDLPEVGSKVEKNETMGAVESVKAASDIYSPVSGKIIEVNKVLNDEPALVNSSAEADGAWPLLPLPLPPPPWPLPRGTPRCEAFC